MTGSKLMQKQKPSLKALGYEVIPIEKCVEADWNYKEDDEFQQQQLKANIMRNDQIENIIVRVLDTGFYEVINGNHRLNGMRDLGFTFIVAFNKGKISLAEAQRIAVETNETKIKPDTIKLSQLMKELNESIGWEKMKETMPFTEQEFQQQMETFKFDWSGETEKKTGEESPDGYSNDKQVIKLVVSAETYSNWVDLSVKYKVKQEILEDEDLVQEIVVLMSRQLKE